jgi:hypothetical protein
VGKFILLGVFLLANLGSAMQEVVAPRVRVLFADPALEPFAQRVANEAERALGALSVVFEPQPITPITIVVVGDTDLYNAVAPPLPRPRTVLHALFPVDTDLGYRAEDDLYLLLVHELTHNLQLAYTERPHGPPRRLGLVGETVAAFPASWFLEGIAVWAESAFTRGGREGDALTLGLRRAAALAGAWPSLQDAGIITFGGWPGGLTRYLYGGFTGYLVERYGIEGMRAALRAHNAGDIFTGFANAWREAVDADLEAEWQAWQASERETAEARAEVAHAGAKRTDTGWYTRAPALSPEGGRLAWVSWPDGIAVAELGEGEARLQERRLVKADRFPRRLGWLDERTLVYNRLVRRPGSDFSELFALDVHTGAEIQLTAGARAQLPSVAPDGCVLFVRDVVTEGSKLQRWCEGEIETLWLAPSGQHIVGVAAGASGVALSLWRPGGYVDLGLLEGETFSWLTQDRAQNLEPAWQDDGRLVFRSDYDEEAFDLYALHLDSHTLRRLTRTVGGAFQPLAVAESLWYVELGARGYDLAELLTPLDEAPRALVLEALPVHLRPIERYEVRDYSPLGDLLPYGWLPTEASFDTQGAGLAVSVFGQDDAGLHNYQLTAGYDSRLQGQLAGGYANLRYGYRENTLLQAFQRPEPLSFALHLGLWPHAPHLGPSAETALGVTGGVFALLPLDLWTGSLRLTAGLVRLESFGAWQPELRLDVALSEQRSDLWGYRTRGWRFDLTGLVSATDLGASPGAWAETSYVQPLRPLGLPGRLTASARGGYRMAPPLPLRLGPWAATMSLGYGHGLPLGWHYRDGLYAVERLSLEPRMHLWFDGTLGLGAELGVFFDTVIHYGAPLAVGLSLGYGESLWYRLGYRLPL